MTQAEKFDTWGTVELFGHVRLGGRISEALIAGAPFIRVDIPETERQPAFTRFLGPNAIYAITPTSEEIARSVAAYSDHEPVRSYELRRLAAGGPPEADGVDDDYDD